MSADKGIRDRSQLDDAQLLAAWQRDCTRDAALATWAPDDKARAIKLANAQSPYDHQRAVQVAARTEKQTHKAARLQRKNVASKDTADEFETLRTAHSVMASNLAPAKYCVADRVPCGLVIIGGRPKSRKSWYALQLSIAKATGGKFMGVQTTPGRILYIALEDNDRRMRQRLEFFGLTPATAPANLHLEYEWPTGLEGIEKIERWLAQFPDTVLVIINVLQRFRGARNARASAYEEDYRTMAMLHGVAQRHDGLALLVVHHVRKGPVDDAVEALNGTFAIAGSVDAYIILRRGTGEQWIAHIDGRDWESWDHEFCWEFLPREGWRHVGLNEVELTATQKEIIRYATDNESITPTELARFRQVAKPTAHEALKALVAKGAMRVYAGRYYPNK